MHLTPFLQCTPVFCQSQTAPRGAIRVQRTSAREKPQHLSPALHCLGSPRIHGELTGRRPPLSPGSENLLRPGLLGRPGMFGSPGLLGRLGRPGMLGTPGPLGSPGIFGSPGRLGATGAPPRLPPHTPPMHFTPFWQWTPVFCQSQTAPAGAMRVQRVSAREKPQHLSPTSHCPGSPRTHGELTGCPEPEPGILGSPPGTFGICGRPPPGTFGICGSPPPGRFGIFGSPPPGTFGICGVLPGVVAPPQIPPMHFTPFWQCTPVFCQSQTAPTGAMRVHRTSALEKPQHFVPGTHSPTRPRTHGELTGFPKPPGKLGCWKPGFLKLGKLGFLKLGFLNPGFLKKVAEETPQRPSSRKMWMRRAIAGL